MSEKTLEIPSMALALIARDADSDTCGYAHRECEVHGKNLHGPVRVRHLVQGAITTKPGYIINVCVSPDCQARVLRECHVVSYEVPDTSHKSRMFTRTVYGDVRQDALWQEYLKKKRGLQLKKHAKRLLKQELVLLAKKQIKCAKNAERLLRKSLMMFMMAHLPTVEVTVLELAYPRNVIPFRRLEHRKRVPPIQYRDAA